MSVAKRPRMLGNRGEHVYLDSRRHGIVLAPALARAFLIAAVGGFLFSVGSVFPIAGAGLVMAAARLIAARRSGILLLSRRHLASMRTATEFRHAQTARRAVEMS